MSTTYDQRYNLTKPPCFGDPRVFSVDDPGCKACDVRGTCKYQVEQKQSGSGRTWVNTSPPAGAQPPAYIRPSPQPQVSQPAQSPTTTATPPRPDIRRIDPHPAATFGGVLFVNGTLNALTSVFQEVVYALFSIPQQRYPNPFVKREDPPPKS